MIGTALLLLLAAQSQQQPLRQEGPAAWPDTVEEAYSLNVPAAREKIAGYGRCVAAASPDKAGSLLAMDFTSVKYRTGLRTLSDNNRDCFGRGRGRMRASNLLFAASVAEALLARDTTPLNVRLARAAAGPAAPTYGPSDAAAMCTVRSAPDEVAALFATTVASEEETKAANVVAPVFGRCGQGGKPVSTTVEGLRAMLATAAFRSINSGAKPVTSN